TGTRRWRPTAPSSSASSSSQIALPAASGSSPRTTCDKLDRIGNPEAGDDTNGARDLESSLGQSSLGQSSLWLRLNCASRRRGRLLRLRFLGETGKSRRSQRLSGKLQKGRADVRENPSPRVPERARSFDLDARAETIRNAKPVFRLPAS